MLLHPTNRERAAAIRDVLEQYGSTGDAPPRQTLPRWLLRLLRRRRRHPSRSSLLAFAAAAAVVPTGVLADDAEAADFRVTWASWYGPGLWGNPLGCSGKPLERDTVGVAHRTMRCGKRLRFCARKCETARVIDRGPFIAGREFDFTQALKDAVGLRIGASGAGRVFVRAAAD